MAIADIFLQFKKQIETSDEKWDEKLKTHYYKGGFDQVFETVEAIIRQDADCMIKTVSKENGEITVEVAKPSICCLVAKLISEEQSVTGVNFAISVEKPTLLGIYQELKARIISFYERIDKSHTLIGLNKKS